MLFHQEPVYKNISISILDRISALLLKPSRERSIAARQVEQLQIRPAAVELEPRHALRRQSAEGRAREMAELSAARAGAVRADARHGRGRKERCDQDHPRLVRRGLPSSSSRPSPRRFCRSPTASSCMKRGAVVREFANEEISKDRLFEAA